LVIVAGEAQEHFNNMINVVHFRTPEPLDGTIVVGTIVGT